MVGTLLALAVWASGTAEVAAQADVVVLDLTQAAAQADDSARIDASAVRLELARTLRAFVVATESADAFGVPPSATITVALTAQQAVISILVVATPDHPAVQQTLTFEGDITHPRLVALLLALVGPSVNIPADGGMNVRVNPYRDATPARTRPEPERPRTVVTFLVPNPYRSRDAASTRRQPAMELIENPYR